MSSRIWTISATFNSSDDAQAAIDLLAELGIQADLHYTRVTQKVSPARTWRSGKAILEAMRKGRVTWYSEDLNKLLEDAGYSPRTGVMIANRLVAEGDLIRPGPGRYQLTDRTGPGLIASLHRDEPA